MSPAVAELRIPLRYLTLSAKTWGDPRHPPMLALHGWLDNAGSFDRLAPLLDSHYLVALDLAGHGRSDHRAPGNWYAYVDYLGEIAEVIAWFGWRHVDLLGHSLGATLVSAYAAIFPEKVSRLLLIEGLGPIVTSAEKTLEQLRGALSARAAFKGDLRVFPAIERAVDARRRASGLSNDAARCLVERGTRHVDAQDSADEGGAMSSGYVWSSDPRLTLPSAQRFSEEQLAFVLPAIRAPTLLVLAEPEAPYLQRAMIEARIARVADIEVVRFAGSHHLHLEDAPPVAQAIRSFLHRHPAQTAGAS
jgi:pimeloyl-ACP methyl ester carboxylesterase